MRMAFYIPFPVVFCIFIQFFIISAVKGIEFGEGFDAAYMKGSENNDAFIPSGNKAEPYTNHAGGVLGGITSGAPLTFRVAVKPTPSISMPQQTVTSDGEAATITIKGRHDVCIVPRLGVVIEAMTGAVLADHLLRNMSSRLENILKLYR